MEGGHSIFSQTPPHKGSKKRKRKRKRKKNLIENRTPMAPQLNQLIQIYFFALLHNKKRKRSVDKNNKQHTRPTSQDQGVERGERSASTARHQATLFYDGCLGCIIHKVNIDILKRTVRR
jgi:hypothetical protein